jgi:hypothetical protein
MDRHAWDGLGKDLADAASTFWQSIIAGMARAAASI